MKKKKRGKYDRRLVKVGGEVAYTTGRRVIFGYVVAISKDWRIVTVKFPDYNSKEVFDLSFDQIVPPEKYTARHHKLILGVTP